MFLAPSGTVRRCAVRMRRLFTQERAQTLAEYALMVSIVATGVTLLALIGFRTQIADLFDAVTSCLAGTC